MQFVFAKQGTKHETGQTDIIEIEKSEEVRFRYLERAQLSK